MSHIPIAHAARMHTMLMRLIADGVTSEQAVEIVLLADRSEISRAKLPAEIFRTDRPVRFGYLDLLAIQKIMRAVCIEMDVTANELLSAGRHWRVVQARWVAAALMRALPMSMPEIARSLHRADHSTVVHGFRRLRRSEPLMRLVHQLWTDLPDVFGDGPEREEAA